MKKETVSNGKGSVMWRRFCKGKYQEQFLIKEVLRKRLKNEKCGVKQH